MIRPLFAVSVMLPTTTSYYQLPADRSVPWTGAGVPGGIPNYTSVYLPNGDPYGGYSVDPALGNNSTDATSAIQAALNAAGTAASSSTPKVCLLAAGTYRTTGALFLTHNYLVLRGSGTIGSVISMHVADAQPVLKTDVHPTYPGGNEAYQSGWTYLTADSAKGTATITVFSALGFQAGDVVTIDQSDDTYVDLGDSTYNKRNTGSDPASSTQRSVGQTTKIIAVNGTTFTLADPLYRDFKASLVANVYRSANTRTTQGLIGIGLENIGLTGAGGGTGCAAFAYCENSWILNVECDGRSPNAFGLSDSTGNNGMMLQFTNSYHCEIRRCYVHDALNVSPGGGAYGIVLVMYSSKCLIEDCITRTLDKGINMIVTGGGNVVGYNYTDHTWFVNGGNFWQETSIDACHTAFAHDDLIEGNWTENLGGDSTHGNSGWAVFFRNRATGRSSDGTPDQNIAACGITGRSRYYSYVGNVIGPTGTIPNIQGHAPMYVNYWNGLWPAGAEVGDGFGWAMWRIGHSTTPNPPTTGPYWDDGGALAQLLRHGNYDEFTDTIADWIPGANRNLPKSFYLSAKPSFFGANVWPWVEPTGATSGDREKILPAKKRYDDGTPFA